MNLNMVTPKNHSIRIVSHNPNLQSYPAAVRSCSSGECWSPPARWDWWPDQSAAHPRSGGHTCTESRNQLILYLFF